MDSNCQHHEPLIPQTGKKSIPVMHLLQVKLREAKGNCMPGSIWLGLWLWSMRVTTTFWKLQN